MKESKLISNDERRQVAARLRERPFNAGYSVHKDDRAFDYFMEIADACGSGIGSALENMNLTDRLADLIEPEPERTCKPIDPFDKGTKHIVERGLSHYYWPYKGCPECQRDFPQGSNFCPNCGAKVIE